MASSSQLPDNMMNYFKFKAQQRLLLEKENQEWKTFCEQVAPECAACVAERKNTDEKKDVGIQALPKQPVRMSGLPKPSSQTRSRNELDAEVLVNLLTRLEKIDITLSKLCSESSENEKEKEFDIQRKKTVLPAFSNEQFLKVYEDQRKQLVQNSLRASQQKFPSSQPVVHKKPPVIKQNSSFLLPHDLQVKRAAARRAYLSSLQNKPKVSFKNVQKKPVQSNKIGHESQTAPNRIPVSKPKKKVVKRKTEKLDEDKVDTLINEGSDAAAEEVSATVNSLASSLEKSINTHDVKKDGETSPTELKLLADLNGEEMQKEEPREELADKTIINLYARAMEVPKGAVAAKKNTVPTSEIRFHEIKNPPKFTCGITHVVQIDPERARNISHQRETFWSYLESISRTARGNYNPWILNEVLAETILDECISDVVEELEELPSIFAQDLYTKEFAQQVEN